MEDTKTLLFYLLGLAGLIIVSILFTGRPEEPGVEPLLATSSPTKSAITPGQPENQPKACALPPQKLVYKRLQTDRAGQYDVTIPRPDRHELNQVRYWVSDANDCPLLIELTFIPEPTPGNAASAFPKLMKSGLAPTETAGSILRGPIDIVLPVPPRITPILPQVVLDIVR
jgi:hypothetical protein